MSFFIRIFGCLILFTSSGLSTPQQTFRDGEAGYSLQQPAEIPSQLYNTPTVPPPTVPTIPPRQPPSRPETRPPPSARPPPPPASPSQPDQLYTQPQAGDASGNTGSVLFPESLNQQQSPPNILPSPSPSARPPAGRPSAPAPGPTPPQGGGAMVGMPYEFEWEVNDLENGNVYSHVQSSDGAVAQGSYRVLLPDGRLQIVEFVDRGRGYEATVRYEVYSGGAQVIG